MSTIFADLRIEVRRYRRMDIKGFNVVLETFSFDLKVQKQLDPTVACVAGAFQRGSKILQFNGSQRITCDQAFFFSGKGKTKVSQTKREEGPPDRRLLNGQMRLINYQLKYLSQLSTASRDFGATIKFLRLDGRRIL